jgi:hypothetical protein
VLLEKHNSCEESLYTAALKIVYQVQYSSLIHDLFCLQCNVKIKQDNEKSDNPQNNAVFKSDSPSTEMIKCHSLKVMSMDCFAKKKLAFSLVQNITSEKHCLSHNNQAFV